jgi:uncharacterized membrane protein YhaH (DUF805 family)
MENSATPDATERARGGGWTWWFAGRASRREYWIYIGLLIVLGVVFSYSPPAVNLVMYLVFTVIMVRRVHDFGRTGWWAWAAAALPFSAMLLLMVTSETVASLVSLVITVALMIAVGAIRGDPGANRFGPPPPVTLKRILTGR